MFTGSAIVRESRKIDGCYHYHLVIARKSSNPNRGCHDDKLNWRSWMELKVLDYIYCRINDAPSRIW
jgi:hypothetical protein